MKKLFIIATILLFPLTVYCQDIKNLYPKIGPTPDFSLKRQKKFERRDALLDKGYVKEIKLTPAEQKELGRLLEVAPEEYESVWSILGMGCSWYCGGGPYKIRASSELKPSGKTDYKAKNAHDFSFKTAWVEGAKGYGKGEYLEYFFKNESPRITDIIVHNGYVKDKSLWRNNSRVKKLKMYVNDKPFAILNLKDTTAEQNFKVEPLGRRKDGKDLVLKFEIMEVYKGKKYDDVAITQIYFDGLDVHCLARGTKITMADGTWLPIEELQAGDEILAYDTELQKFTPSRIDEFVNVKHCNLIKLKFADNTEIITTADHPFLLVGNTWASLDPDKTSTHYGYERVQQYSPGDLFLIYEDGAKEELELLSITPVEEAMETYTISGLEKGDAFIANGMLVGIENY